MENVRDAAMFEFEECAKSMTLDDFKRLTKEVNDANGWAATKEDLENKWFVAGKLALIHSEVSEALEADRGEKVFEKTEDSFINEDGRFQLGYMRKQTEEEKVESIRLEIADVMIRCLDFCNIFDIDIAGIIYQKLLQNSKRAYKHDNKKI